MSLLRLLALAGPTVGALLAGPSPTRPDDPAPPLDLEFVGPCGPPDGRPRAYDPAAGVFHVHFRPPAREGGFGSGLYKRSAVRVTKVNGPFARPVVFRLTGVPADFGCAGDPLALVSGAADPADPFDPGVRKHPLVAAPLARGPVDPALVRAERAGGAVTLTFTKKGEELLRPGAAIAFRVDTGW